MPVKLVANSHSYVPEGMGIEMVVVDEDLYLIPIEDGLRALGLGVDR